MRHRKDESKLRRPHSHRKALVHSLVRSLILHDRITTTVAKAKTAQRLAERLVSRSKVNDLAARRYAYYHLNDYRVVKHLFDEIRPRFEDRTSGFTRIFLMGNRYGDGAQMAVLEMTLKGEPKKTGKEKKKSTAKVQSREPSATKTKTTRKEKTEAKKPARKKTAETKSS